MTTPLMTCPDEGRLRAWLDHEIDERPADFAAHLTVCSSCQRTLDGLRADAAVAAAAVSGLGPVWPPSQAQTELARARAALALSARGADIPAAPATVVRPPASFWGRLIPTGHRRVVAAGLAAAVALVAVAVSPPGRNAAAQLLGSFRGEKFQAVPLEMAQFEDIGNAITELSNLGEVSGITGFSPAPRPVSSVAEAAQQAGIAVQEPSAGALPAGANPTPQVQVFNGGEVRFTFDEAKARAYFQSIGQPNVKLPAKFDGASLVVHVPNGVLLQYTGGKSSGLLPIPGAVFVGQAGLLTVDAEGGVTLDELRDFLLSLPGLSAKTAQQLRSMSSWQTTVPIPVPVDFVDTRRGSVGGRDALILTDKLGITSAVLWQNNGRTLVVAGIGSAQDMTRVGESLR